MKPRKETVGKKLDRALGLFGKPSRELMDSVQERVATNLELEAGEGFQSSKLEQHPVRRSPWRATAMVAAAIALLVLIPLTMLHRAPAVFQDAAGSRNIQFGEVVRASDTAGSTLVLTDTSRVEMRAKSELVLERADDGVRIRLRNGDIIVNAAKQHGHLYVQTKEVTVSVVGTVFLVKAEAEGSRVAVIEGEVHVQQGAKETKLRPGEEVTTSPKMEAIAVKEELAWSSQAVTHAALLQQAASKESVTFELASIRPTSKQRTLAATGARGGVGHEEQRQPTIQLDLRRFAASDVPLSTLIAWAYGRCQLPGSTCLYGGPDWLESARWDIEALIPEGSIGLLRFSFNKGPEAEFIAGRVPKLQKMLQALLEDRFRLQVRSETKELPVYIVTVGKDGPKFAGTPTAGTVAGLRGATFIGPDGAPTSMPADAEIVSVNVPNRCDRGIGECGKIVVGNLSMTEALRQIEGLAGRPVLDRTGIQEKVGFVFEWPLPSGFNIRTSSPLPGRQALSKAFEAIGLQLEEDPKGHVETLVVERAEKPSEN